MIFIWGTGIGTNYMIVAFKYFYFDRIAFYFFIVFFFVVVLLLLDFTGEENFPFGSFCCFLFIILMEKGGGSGTWVVWCRIRDLM